MPVAIYPETPTKSAINYQFDPETMDNPKVSLTYYTITGTPVTVTGDDYGNSSAKGCFNICLILMSRAIIQAATVGTKESDIHPTINDPDDLPLPTAKAQLPLKMHQLARLINADLTIRKFMTDSAEQENPAGYMAIHLAPDIYPLIYAPSNTPAIKDAIGKANDILLANTP